jgi:hypothetical protein
MTVGSYSQCSLILNQCYVYKMLPVALHNIFSLFCFLLSQNIKINFYRRISVRFVLYGSATWSLTLRENRGLRMFENRVQRDVCGAQTDEVTKI